MTPPRPSTHPAEEYRRRRKVLDEVVADVVEVLARLDPEEVLVYGDELADALAQTWAVVAHLVAEAVPGPRATITPRPDYL